VGNQSPRTDDYIASSTTASRRRSSDSTANRSAASRLASSVLRLEEHDDPAHPVVKLATRRIEELSAQRAAIGAAIQSLGISRPEGARPDEIEALLDQVPDMRASLQAADPGVLADLFDAFDVTTTYDKPNRTLTVAATVTPELVLENENPRRAVAPSGKSFIAGAGFEPATFGL
jgi:hypothetical protein